MKKINIAFGIHNHQPVGNFDFVFEEAYEKSYRPFLEVLEKHPDILMAQHYTGVLFQWLVQHKPEFAPRLRKLVESGQIEMMTGGFYEPILSVIPYADKVGQIKKLTEFVKKHTGYDAKGMWLAERIWEPQLPKPCAEAGVKYVVLDDSHFKNSGLKEEELRGYFITEEEGQTVYLFPIAETLRYTIPFQPPEKTIEFLESIATDDGQALVVFADDGEKFGVWPGTYEHCYENTWLERFFRELEKNRGWINIIHLSQALEQLKPLGRIYLPTASYREMMEWAMPTNAIKEYEQFEDLLKRQELHDRFKVFVRGGFWRNFMMKYPESNNMHKKMLFLRQRLATLEPEFADRQEFKQAQDHIWAGQCNCPYWHGVFGGLYLNHLRYATYHEFLQAEALLDSLELGGKNETGWLRSVTTDFDGDGTAEILISNPQVNLYLAPERGGCLFELDHKKKAVNLLDTMTRREESYHEKLKNCQKPKTGVTGANKDGDRIASIHELVLMKEPDLDKLLFYDWYRRTSLLDHFLAPGTTLDEFYQSRYEEAGDFVTAPYVSEIVEEGDQLVVKLWRDGHVWIAKDWVPVGVEKTVTLNSREAAAKIDYCVKNLDTKAREVWFGTEFDIALLAGDAPDRKYFVPGAELEDSRLRSKGVVDNATELQLRDDWLKLAVQIKSDQAAAFWRFPIETISQSEGGFERVYQSSVVFPNWKLRLAPGETWKVRLQLNICDL